MCPLPSPIPLWFYHTPACCVCQEVGRLAVASAYLHPGGALFCPTRLPQDSRHSSQPPQASRVQTCCLSSWISHLQEGWARSMDASYHARRCFHTSRFGFFPCLKAVRQPTPVSPKAWSVLMAPKPRRWRYKPGQRERRERREAKAQAMSASSNPSGSREPPLTLYHPRLSSS